MGLFPKVGTPGTWFGLPDFGITEALGFGGNNPLVTNPPNYGTGAGQQLGQSTGIGTNQAVLGGTTTTNTGGTPTGTTGITNTITNPNPVPSGGDTGGGQIDQQSALRNDISNSWDQYINSLSGQGDYINQQRSAQENTANLSQTESLRQTGEQKATSLKDIQNTARNAFTAGNNYLGSMGAGDSSAANQYKFAIDQAQMKQVGDLNNFVSSANQKIQSEHQIQMSQIAQWFSQQQQALQQQIAQGSQMKAQDLNNLSRGILDQAIQWSQQLKTNTMNQQNALAQWAMNNSTNVAGLQQNMGQLGQQSFGGLNINQTQPANKSLFGGTATNTVSNPNFKYMSLEEQNKLLGQPTWGQ